MSKKTSTRGKTNANLHKAKANKNDEFYTRLEDIEAEMKNYRKQFKGKVVLCNCDDPEWSNFFRYFAINFTFLGLKKLISTHYEHNGKSYALIVDEQVDVNGDGKIDLKDAVKVPLEGNGDFRSEECIQFLKEADIVASNPPFSIFREYVALLMKHKKKFIIIGNGNAITYKEIFPYIKNNKMWLGASKGVSGKFPFIAPKDYVNKFTYDEDGVHYAQVNNACWFTNMSHEKRKKPLDLVGNVYTPEKYPKYDNYNAIDSKTADIPDNYFGYIGVPITFLDKYNPEQFEIVGATESEGQGFSNGLWEGGKAQAVVNGVPVYKRIFIRAKKPAKK